MAMKIFALIVGGLLLLTSPGGAVNRRAHE